MVVIAEVACHLAALVAVVKDVLEIGAVGCNDVPLVEKKFLKAVGVIVLVVHFDLVVVGVAVVAPFRHHFVVEGLPGARAVHLLVLVVWFLLAGAGIVVASRVVARQAWRAEAYLRRIVLAVALVRPPLRLVLVYLPLPGQGVVTTFYFTSSPTVTEWRGINFPCAIWKPKHGSRSNIAIHQKTALFALYSDNPSRSNGLQSRKQSVLSCVRPTNGRKSNQKAVFSVNRRQNDWPTYFACAIPVRRYVMTVGCVSRPKCSCYGDRRSALLRGQPVCSCVPRTSVTTVLTAFFAIKCSPLQGTPSDAY